MSKFFYFMALVALVAVLACSGEDATEAPADTQATDPTPTLFPTPMATPILTPVPTSTPVPTVAPQPTANPISTKLACERLDELLEILDSMGMSQLTKCELGLRRVAMKRYALRP